jgi:hypothetical protein
MLTEAPEAVDAIVVGSSPEPGAQQETGENEPGLLVVRRLLAPSHTALESRPERTDESRIPFALRHSENLLKASKNPCRCQRFSSVGGTIKRGRNARSGGFECLRGDIRLSSNRSVWDFYCFGNILAVLLVRAKIEFQWPALADRRVRADASDLQQTQFVRTGNQGDRELVGGCPGSRGRDTNDRFQRRKGVVVLFAPIGYIACFASAVARGVIGLEACETIRLHLERKSRDLKPLLGHRPTGENTHKRSPSPFSSFGRPLPKYFEEHRARGTGLDAFCAVIENFSVKRRAARNREVGICIFQRERRAAALPFCDLLTNPFAQELRTKGAAVEQDRVDTRATPQELGKVTGNRAVGGIGKPPLFQGGLCPVRVRPRAALGEEAIEEYRLDFGTRQLGRPRRRNQPGPAAWQ